MRVYPENLPLRHYIAISAEHFRRKYRDRKFPAEELARGWHIDRTQIDTEHVKLPSPRVLKRFSGDDPATLDRSEIWTRHFWETNRPTAVNIGSSLAPSRPAPVAALAAVGRNDPCPCGSGRKYKNCHGPLVREHQLKKAEQR